jgi:hypothetical protein
VQLVFSCKCVISLLQSPSPRLQGRGTAHFTLIPKRLFIGDQAALQLHMCPNRAGRTLAAPTQAPLKWGDAGHRLADISLMLSTNPRGPKWQTLSRGLSGGGMAVGGPAHSLQFLLLAIHCTISLTGLRALTSPTHRKGSHSPQGGEIQAAFPSTRTSMRGK